MFLKRQEFEIAISIAPILLIIYSMVDTYLRKNSMISARISQREVQ